MPHFRVFLVGLGLTLFPACASSENAAAPELAGAYAATSLRLGVQDFKLDVLAPGGELTLTLNPDSSFSGHLFLPSPYAPFSNDTSAYDLEFGGTWTCCQPNVVLQTNALTFFDNAVVRVRGDSLLLSVITQSAPPSTLYLEATLAPQ